MEISHIEADSQPKYLMYFLQTIHTWIYVYVI